jgi:hypothetical protein
MHAEVFSLSSVRFSWFSRFIFYNFLIYNKLVSIKIHFVYKLYLKGPFPQCLLLALLTTTTITSKMDSSCVPVGARNPSQQSVDAAGEGVGHTCGGGGLKNDNCSNISTPPHTVIHPVSRQLPK